MFRHLAGDPSVQIGAGREGLVKYDAQLVHVNLIGQPLDQRLVHGLDLFLVMQVGIERFQQIAARF